MTPPEAFTWADGERLIAFGAGVLADGPDLLAARGFDDYCLLTTERGLTAAPDFQWPAAAVVNVPSGLVPEAAAAVRAEVGVRPLVALGGGRVIDVAKALAAADGLPCAAIPSTLAGSPLTRIHRLPSGVSGAGLVRPSLVLADPELMASQPMPALAGSAMNALGHAVESLWVPLRGPVTDMAALRAATLISSALAGDADPVRGDLALGALLAGWAVGSTGYAIHHPVCQTLVALAGTPHAETNAIVLPHSIRAMAERAPEAIGRLGAALAGDGRRAEALEPGEAADLVAVLAARAGPTRLSELGVTEALLPEVVEAVTGRPELDSSPGGRPSDNEITAILESAL